MKSLQKDHGTLLATWRELSGGNSHAQKAQGAESLHG
jgi:hypothetical protein